jgi:hypothetical protein
MNLSFHDLKSRAEGFQMRTYLRAKLQIGSTAPNFFFQNCPKISRACMGLYGPAWPSCVSSSLHRFYSAIGSSQLPNVWSCQLSLVSSANVCPFVAITESYIIS